MPTDEERDRPKEFEVPEEPPMAERSLELPAVIIGDRGEEEAPLETRLLPGRLRESFVLYPVYALVGLSALLAGHFALQSGEWNLLMALLGWGLLYCWVWVYGVAYRYRRRVMKYLSLVMSLFTAGSLIFVSALRAASMPIPGPNGLVIRGPETTLYVVVALTALSAAAILAHVLFLGRGYREKVVRDKKKPSR